MRTTVEDVQGILRSDYDATDDLSVPIRAASSLTDRVAAKATADGTTFSAADARLVETYLAAHIAMCGNSQKRPVQSANSGRSGATFQGRTGEGLRSTFYGQTAITLDPTGLLEQIAEGGVQTAWVAYLGTDPAVQRSTAFGGWW